MKCGAFFEDSTVPIGTPKKRIQDLVENAVKTLNANREKRLIRMINGAPLRIVVMYKMAVMIAKGVVRWS